jgi:hypothetical protein
MRRNAEGNYNPMVYPQFPFGIPGEKRRQRPNMQKGYTLFNMVVRELRYGGYLPDRPATHITQYEVRDALLNPKFGKWDETEWVEESPPVNELYTHASFNDKTKTQILRIQPNTNTNYYVTEKSWAGGKMLEMYPYPRPEFRVEKEAGITVVYEELPKSFRMRSQWGEKLAKFWDIMTNLPPEQWDSTLYAYALGLVVGRTNWQNDIEEHNLLTIIGELNLMLGFDVRKGEEIYGFGLPSQQAVFSVNEKATYVEMAETYVIHRLSPPEDSVDITVNYTTDTRFMQNIHASPYGEAITYKELRLQEVRV